MRGNNFFLKWGNKIRFPVVTSEGLNLRFVVLHKNQKSVLYKFTKSWVLPVKTYLTAPYLVKGVSKNWISGLLLTFPFIYGGQNQKPPERRWCPPKQTYNWIAAKRRINRHDLYGASAAERLTAQRRAGLPVRKVSFGSTENIKDFLRLAPIYR